MEVERAEIERRLADFQEVARKAGVKLTHQRLEIYREVAGRTDHPSAEDVLQAVKQRMPTVSLDTVYRTLWMLRDLGLVSTLGPKRGSVRFDANLEKHHHFVCDRCGLIRDFDSAEFDALRIPEAVEKMGRIDAAHVEVSGVCSQCAEKENVDR